MTEMPPAPERAFASDNAAGAHPDVVAAFVAANDGHALAYGSDDVDAQAAAAGKGDEAQAALHQLLAVHVLAPLAATSLAFPMTARLSAALSRRAPADSNALGARGVAALKVYLRVFKAALEADADCEG